MNACSVYNHLYSSQCFFQKKENLKQTVPTNLQLPFYAELMSVVGETVAVPAVAADTVNISDVIDE